MGMACYEPVKRKPRNKGASLCEKCGAEYINNGGWYKGYETQSGTATPEVSFVRDIPANCCPICN